MHPIDLRLQQHGIVLPAPPPPAANYVPFVVSGSLLFIAGQLPMENGVLAVKGRLGETLAIDEGIRAARLCALNILAQARAASEGFVRLGRLVKLGGFVSCVPSFTEHPRVLNGASDFMADILGEAGKHVRFAVGAASLPFDAAVEIEAQFSLV